MQVGHALLEVARATGAPSLFFVGTGKNVGKTVAMRAVYEAAHASGLRCGLSSIGRDGEAVDVGDSGDKPRLYLHPNTIVATARDVLPVTPASELLDLSMLRTAAGMLTYARVRSRGFYELIGPPTVSGIASCVERLLQYADYAIIDGAIDRVAALGATHCSVVVACGAAGASTMEEAVEEIRALVHRLTLPQYDGVEPCVAVEGALTPAMAQRLIATHERRPVVLQDATRLMLTGRTAETAFKRLNIQCRRAIRVVAATVASIGREHYFEPRAFARAVRDAVDLPVFDVYAGHAA